MELPVVPAACAEPGMPGAEHLMKKTSKIVTAETKRTRLYFLMKTPLFLVRHTGNQTIN